MTITIQKPTLSSVTVQDSARGAQVIVVIVVTRLAASRPRAVTVGGTREGVALLCRRVPRMHAASPCAARRVQPDFGCHESDGARL